MDEIEQTATDAGMDVEYPALCLRKGEDARLRAGHLWVFSNEVDVKRSPLTAFRPGEVAVVLDHAGKPLGIGYVNPNALICARLVTRGIRHPLDRSLIVHRLNVALALRERLYERPYYRLVYGESDGLPGLVLDRYGDVVVGQIATAGMEALRGAIVEAVAKVLRPAALVWKNAGSVRRMESLPEYVEAYIGALPASATVEEGGLRSAIDPVHGQKTGWFYDQRGNRDALAPLVRGKRVLDLFSYAGAWGLRAAAMGASEVHCVDASASAVAAIRANAESNGLADRVQAIEADAFEHLQSLRQQREHYDVVILDPPAFIKRKKDLVEGRLAYRRLNEAGMQVVARDGILVSCSCSYHLPRAALLEALQQGARHLDRSLQVLMQLQQGRLGDGDPGRGEPEPRRYRHHGRCPAAALSRTRGGDDASSRRRSCWFGSVYITASQMPEPLATISIFSPATYVIEGIRSALIDGKGFGDLWLTMLGLVASGLVMVPLGVMVFSAGERYAKRTGRLKRSG